MGWACLSSTVNTRRCEQVVQSKKKGVYKRYSGAKIDVALLN